jgi:hypothetical protein
MNGLYKRESLYIKNKKTHETSSEMSEENKNDLLLAFNLYKNDHNKINKTKLRTILFSFLMYKSSPKDINEYINENFKKQDEFSFEDLCRLINQKMYNLYK